MSRNVDEIQAVAYGMFSTLPNKLTPNNIGEFVKTCAYVDKLCDAPKLHRLLMPFHNLTFGWESAYGEGFTWAEFLEDIVKSGCVDVTCSKTTFGAALWFGSKSASGVCGRPDFCISLEHDD